MRKIGLSIAALAAALAVAGCQQRSGTQSGGQADNSASAKVDEAQQRSEQAFDQARNAQDKASSEQQDVKDARQQLSDARQQFDEAQQKFQKEQQEAQQAQQQAVQQGQQAQQVTQQSQQQALQAQQQAQQEEQQRQQQYLQQQQNQQAQAQQPAQDQGAVMGGSGQAGSEKQISGEVMLKSGNSIDVRVPDKGAYTLQVDPSTQVTIDGQQASADQIARGQEVQASYVLEGSQRKATRLDVRSATGGGAQSGSGSTQQQNQTY